MAIVRVVIWDEDNFLQRVSTPEDTFLIESIDASGSDSNVLKIGPLSASTIILGNNNIATHVSGALSGNFITGTFYGNGLNLKNVVNFINGLTGSVSLRAGPNVVINSGSNYISFTASSAISDISGALPKEYYYTSSLNASYSTSVSLKEKVYLSATLSGGNYLAFFSNELAAIDAVTLITSSFYVNDIAHNDFSIGPSQRLYYTPNSGFTQFSASENTVLRIYYASEQMTKTVSIKNAKIALWRVF